jgi:mannosyltransferase OCH1-like enzyme
VTIPRVFHSLWTGPPMPEHLAAYLLSWQRVNQGWRHQIWADTDLGWLANQDLYDFADAITPSAGQLRADVARYEILHRYGGVWVDCDFEALAPIDELLIGVDCFAAWEIDDTWVGNAILGAAPGHPFYAELIAGLPANVKAHRGKRPNVLTGPQYLTPVARRHDITLFPAAMFYPYRYDELHRDGESFPAAYAVHHWANARKRAVGRV